MREKFYQPPPPSLASGAGDGLSAVLVLSDGLPALATSPFAAVLPPTALAVPHAAQKSMVAKQIDLIGNLRVRDTNATRSPASTSRRNRRMFTPRQAFATHFFAESSR